MKLMLSFILGAASLCHALPSYLSPDLSGSSTGSPPCPSPAVVSWTQGSVRCEANVIADSLEHGTSVNVSDSLSPATGSATVTCNNGKWVAIGFCSTEACTPTESLPYPDGVDNDCDGVIDESHTVGKKTIPGCPKDQMCLQGYTYANPETCTGVQVKSGGPVCGPGGYCDGKIGYERGTGCSYTDPGTAYYD